MHGASIKIKIGVPGHYALCMTSLQTSKNFSEYHEIWYESSATKDVSKHIIVRFTNRRDGSFNKIA